MKDKEIIIDGVDICNCEFHSSTPSSELCYMKGNKCNNNINCYYKQFRRKEQEFDRYKQALEKIEEIVKEEIVCDNCNLQGTNKCDSRLCTSFYLNDFCKQLFLIINEVKDGTIQTKI